MKSTRDNWLRAIVFASILVFYGVLLLHKIQLPVDDLGRHIMNGKMLLEGNFKVLTTNFYSLTESSSPFINHHWLFGVLAYLLNTLSGFFGLTIFNAILALAGFTLLFLASVRKADFWLTTLLSLPTIVLLSDRIGVRPEMVSFFFISFYIYLLAYLDEHPETKSILWLIPAQLIWVNSHIYFPIGVMLLGGYIVEKIIVHRHELRRNKLIRKLVLLWVGLVLVCFINPSGIKGALYPLHIFDHYAVSVTENLSPFSQAEFLWRDKSVAILGPMMLILGLSFVFSRKKRSIFYLLAAVGSAVAAAKMERNISLFALVFLPAISANLNTLFLKARTWLMSRYGKRYKYLSLALAVLMISTFAYGAYLASQENRFLVYNQPGLGLTAQSSGAADFFLDQNLHGPIFNDYDIGSYLVYYLFPKERPFVDNRPEAYPDSFLTDVVEQSMWQESVWQETDSKYHFNAIIFYQRDASQGANNFLWRRVADPDWSLVYADTYSVIFLRNNGENSEAINKFRITKDNVEERLGPMLISDHPEDLLSAGHIFEMAGREDLAINAYRKMIEKWPSESPGYTVIGLIESQSNDPKDNLDAITMLGKAISLGEKTAENYTYLGLAYFKSAQFSKASDNLEQALKIEPDRADASDYLSQLQPYLNMANSTSTKQ